MNDKEFRRLHRKDLIEIIYQYQCREQQLSAQNEALQAELLELRAKNSDADSLSDASLAMKDVFSAAQKAADQYLTEIKALHEKLFEKFSENIASPSLAQVSLINEVHSPTKTTA